MNFIKCWDGEETENPVTAAKTPPRARARAQRHPEAACWGARQTADAAAAAAAIAAASLSLIGECGRRAASSDTMGWFLVGQHP